MFRNSPAHILRGFGRIYGIRADLNFGLTPPPPTMSAIRTVIGSCTNVVHHSTASLHRGEGLGYVIPTLRLSPSARNSRSENMNRWQTITKNIYKALQNALQRSPKHDRKPTGLYKASQSTTR